MVDIIIIIVLFLGTYMGYRAGFIKQLFSLVTTLLGYIISFALSSRLAILLSDLIPLYENPLLKNLSNTLTEFDIPSGYHRIIAFFVIFFLVKFFMNLIANILGVFTKLPIIKSANKILGAIFGLIESYLIIFACIYIIYVLPINISNDYILEAKLPKLIIEQTPVLSDMLLKQFFNYIK